MKFTKLSLVAALAVSTAFAGGDITPVEPVVEAPAAVADCNKDTTIAGKLTGYYITNDADSKNDMFSKEASQLGLAATLDVAHKVTDWMTLNFSAVGYVNALKQPNLVYMEGDKHGAFFNVANATFNYADTTFVAGRQLLATPMLGGFDWLLAPGAFEAYTLVNNSFENVTLVGSYVRTWRPNNQGDTWYNLRKDADVAKLTGKKGGDNWTVGAAYDDKTINGSVWYYNVDAADYTQVYADAGYNFDIAKVAAQYVNTDYNAQKDSTAYGIKISGTVADIDLSAAYNKIQDNKTGYVGVDSLYTSSWNTFTSAAYDNEDLDAFKISASTKIAGVSAELSYADYDKGNETDLILGYDITESIDAGLVYTNTKANVTNADAVNALEVFANYKF